MLYSPVRCYLFQNPPKSHLKETAQLACVKHAASVHPEPGSNSPKIKSAFLSPPYLLGFSSSFSFVKVPLRAVQPGCPARNMGNSTRLSPFCLLSLFVYSLLKFHFCLLSLADFLIIQQQYHAEFTDFVTDILRYFLILPPIAEIFCQFPVVRVIPFPALFYFFMCVSHGTIRDMNTTF